METPLAASLAGVTRRFAKTRALDSVDFRVGRCEVVALLGPNGPGKTTVVRILLAINKVGARNRVDAARIARAKGWL